MFKSIEYKLIIALLLVILSTVASTYCCMTQQYVYLSFTLLILVLSIISLRKNYGKFNQNILFLLNALDNGDYSFHFAESKISARERELNAMMNRIKEILSRARKEVIENEKFLSLILESVSTGILIVDSSNIIQKSNLASHKLLGMPIMTHLKQLKNIEESLPEKLMNLNVNDSFTLKIQNEREEIQLNVQCSKITLKEGVVKIITLNNIGNELEAKEMESWVRLIRVMTHEIMNSVAPITSLSETLLSAYQANDDAVDADLKNDTIEALQTITSTAKGLISFVDSYRKFTGIPTPEVSEIEILPLIENILLLEIQSSQLDIEVKVNCPSRQMIIGDKSQVSQVLINLIKNAIEATQWSEDKKIVINVIDSEKSIDLEVRNSGTPIPANIAPHIFIPFFTTKDGGSGIGLSISRYIMRLHGGNLKHHTHGQWTVFSMIFNKSL